MTPPARDSDLVELVRAVRAAPERRGELALLLREDHPIHQQQGRQATARMRGWILATFEHVGTPPEAMVYVIEELETGLEAYVVAAAARASRSCAPRATLSAGLVHALRRLQGADDLVSFARYGAYPRLGEGVSALVEIAGALRVQTVWTDATRTDIETLARGEFFGADVRAELQAALVSQPRSLSAAPPGPGRRADALDCCDLPEDAEPRDPAVLGTIELEDHRGARISLAEALGGRPAVVVFFYTRCDNPAKCPLSINRLVRLQGLLEDRGGADAVSTIALTYDPAFDSAPRLRAYGEARGWSVRPHHRLARSVDGIAAVNTYFGLRVGFVGSLVNRHRTECFVVDGTGAVRRTFARLQWDEHEVLRALDEAQGVAAPGVNGPGEAAPALAPPLRPESRLLTSLGFVPALAAAFFPRCPACWAAYLSVFGVAGLERIPYLPTLRPFLVMASLANLVALWIRGRRGGLRRAAFWVATSGAFMLLIAVPVFDWSYASKIGVALTVLGSALSVFRLEPRAA